MPLCWVWRLQDGGHAAAIPGPPGPVHPPSRPCPASGCLGLSIPLWKWCCVLRGSPQKARKKFSSVWFLLRKLRFSRGTNLISCWALLWKHGGPAGQLSVERRPGTCPWDNERIQERMVMTHNNYFIWVFSLCRAHSCYTLSLDNSQTWTLSGHWSHVGPGVNPLP